MTSPGISFFWGTLDGPGSLNNVISEDLTRYMKKKSRHRDPLDFWQINHKLYPGFSKLIRVYHCPPPIPSSVTSKCAFKVAKNDNIMADQETTHMCGQ